MWHVACRVARPGPRFNENFEKSTRGWQWVADDARNGLPWWEIAENKALVHIGLSWRTHTCACLLRDSLYIYIYIHTYVEICSAVTVFTIAWEWGVCVLSLATFICMEISARACTFMWIKRAPFAYMLLLKTRTIFSSPFFFLARMSILVFARLENLSWNNFLLHPRGLMIRNQINLYMFRKWNFRCNFSILPSYLIPNDRISSTFSNFLGVYQAYTRIKFIFNEIKIIFRSNQYALIVLSFYRLRRWIPHKMWQVEISICFVLRILRILFTNNTND